MDISRFIQEYAKTKKHIQSAVLGASGWELGNDFDHEIASMPSVHVYIFDLPSRYVKMFQIARDSFVSISTNTSIESDEAKGEYRNAVSSILYEIIALGSKSDNADYNRALGAYLCAYAGTTSTWKTAKGLSDGGHFVVLNYRQSIESKSSRLRPFSVVHHGPLPVDLLQSYISSVIEMDQIKHPEWFS